MTVRTSDGGLKVKMKPDLIDGDTMGNQDQEEIETRIHEATEATAGTLTVMGTERIEPATETIDTATTEAIAGVVKRGRLSELSAFRGIRDNVIRDIGRSHAPGVPVGNIVSAAIEGDRARLDLRTLENIISTILRSKVRRLRRDPIATALPTALQSAPLHQPPNPTPWSLSSVHRPHLHLPKSRLAAEVPSPLPLQWTPTSPPIMIQQWTYDLIQIWTTIGIWHSKLFVTGRNGRLKALRG